MGSAAFWTCRVARATSGPSGNTLRRFDQLCYWVREELTERDVILDGEVVALDQEGRQDFRLLMRGGGNLHYAVFDVLWLKGKDLRGCPLSRRKRILSKLVRRTTTVLSPVFGVRGRGRDLFRAVERLDLEGVVAKRLADPCTPDTRPVEPSFRIEASHTGARSARAPAAAAVHRAKDTRGGSSIMALLLIWILCGAAAAMIASNKGKEAVLWSVIGMLVGPFGILFALIAQPNAAQVEQQALASGRRKCPMCAELVRAEAVKCRFCGAKLPPDAAAARAAAAPKAGEFDCPRFHRDMPIAGSSGTIFGTRICADCAAGRGEASYAVSEMRNAGDRGDGRLPDLPGQDPAYHRAPDGRMGGNRRRRAGGRGPVGDRPVSRFQ